MYYIYISRLAVSHCSIPRNIYSERSSDLLGLVTVVEDERTQRHAMGPAHGGSADAFC